MIKMRTASPLSAAALLAASALLFAAPADAAPRCDTPRHPVDLRACDIAQQGPDALRRFVARTQIIYGLYFWDYTTPEAIDRQRTRLAQPAPGADALPVATAR
jgi:hypothetical protein